MSDAEHTATTERLRSLMSGAAEPSSEFVAYHVEQARVAQAEHESLVQAIARATQQLAVLRQRAITTRAQLETHLQAIAAWDSQKDETDGGAAVL